MHHRRLKNKPITNVYTIELFKENTHMHVHCRLPWWQRFSLAREKWWEKKNPWRYRVTILLSMTQCNFRTRLGPISSLDILIRRAPFWPADTHSSCARMTREAKTGYTTSVTSPNSRTTYRAYSTGYWHDFFRGFSFLSIFRVPEKNLCYQGNCRRKNQTVLIHTHTPNKYR